MKQIIAFLMLWSVALAVPTINSFSPDSSVAIGGRITLAVVVSGTGPFTYVWKRDGVQLPNSTNELHTIYSFQASDAGSYIVVVSDSSGSVTSPPAILSIAGLPPPPPPTPIGSKSIPFGAHATLRATANGNPVPVYECFKDGVKVGNLANYPIASATENDAGVYVFRASNGIGPGASSTPINVTIATAPVIMSPFPNVSLFKGDSYTLAVTAYGPGLSYKWKKGGRILAGQTLPTLTISKAKPPDAGTYACEVSNVAGSVEASCKVSVVNR